MLSTEEGLHKTPRLSDGTGVKVLHREHAGEQRACLGTQREAASRPTPSTDLPERGGLPPPDPSPVWIVHDYPVSQWENRTSRLLADALLVLSSGNGVVSNL